MGIYPISLDNVKPCEMFPFFPGKDTAAMKEAGQRYVNRVFEDKNDKRLAGSKADLLREIAFEAGAKSGPDFAEKGYADYDLLGFVDKMGGTVSTWREYLRQLANDAMIIIHKRKNGRKIIFVANEAGIAKFKEIVNAERVKDEARADRRAAAAERRSATAALVGAGRVQPAADTNTEDENEPPVAGTMDAVGCFFVVNVSKDFCVKAQGKLWTSRFSLGKEPTKIEFFPKIFGTFKSKLGYIFLLPSPFLLDSSSSFYILKHCVESGDAVQDDDDDFSLALEAQDEALALDSEEKESEGEDSSDADLPIDNEEEREEDDPAPLPVHVQEYEDTLCPVILGVCDEKFGEKSLREVLDLKLDGASDKTRINVVKTSWKNFQAQRLLEEINKPSNYFLAIVTKEVEKARAAAPARTASQPPAAAPGASESESHWTKVKEAIDAMSPEQREQLTQEATSLTALSFQKWNTVIKQNERSLVAERMGFEVDQTWKVAADAT